MTARKKRSFKTTVELTQRALNDLVEIEQYSIKQWGRKIAERYLDDVAEALDRLIEDSNILRLEPDLCPGLYFYRVKKHVLVCDLESESVIVLIIIHSSMDLPSRLQELQPSLVAESRILRVKMLHRKLAQD